MDTLSMKNVIAIQTEYIDTMEAISQKSRNYAVVLAKASKKAMYALLDMGLRQPEAERAMYDAHDMLHLQGLGK